MMKVFVAIDSFKGAAGSAAACRAAADALREAGVREADVREFPISDGGEGFCECIHHYLGGTWIPLSVTGPEGRTVEAKYLIVSSEAPTNRNVSGAGSVSEAGGISEVGGISEASGAAPKTAFIESASACGYTLVSAAHPDPREQSTDSATRPDPRELTSAGVGELIADAIRRGCTRVVLGLGGTATMDAGLGLYTALRNAFSAATGSTFPAPQGSTFPAATGSTFPAATDTSCPAGAPLGNIEFTVCIDTFAPLTGPTGAAYMYGPQKGLRKDQLAEADAWLSRQASRLGLSPTAPGFGAPGFGAAGGLLCGLTACLRHFAERNAVFTPCLRHFTERNAVFPLCLRQNAEGKGPTLKIVSGAEYLIELSGLKEAVKEAAGKDNILIITGEGCLDEQSLTGKLTGRIATLATEQPPATEQTAEQAAEQTAEQTTEQTAEQATEQSRPRTKAICLSGSIGQGFDPANSPFDEVLVITPEGTPLSEALAATADNIRRTLLNYCHNHPL